MSRSKRDYLDTESMLQRLTKTLAQASNAAECTCAEEFNELARRDAEQLRRISMTLHRWHELECGVDGGCIERGSLTRHVDSVNGSKVFKSDENGKPYFANHNGERTTYHKIPDREAGALKRLAAVMARYPSLTSYVQGDPRGCALYILRPGDVPAGEDAGAFYSRGLAVHQ